MTVHLAVGETTAVVDPDQGGRLASLVVAGHQRLIDRADPGAQLPPVSWGSFPMIPWVGRMRRGELDIGGAIHRLPPNFGAHAIHGLAFHVPWEVATSTERLVELRRRLGDGDGWPVGAWLGQTIELSEDAISFRIEVTADAPMPIAVGWHPWFRRRLGSPIVVSVPADAVLETSDDMIPTGAIIPVAGPTDLRRPADLGDRALDHAYVGVSGPSRIAWPDLELTIEAAPLGSIVVHSTPRAVCVEPQTAWPDAHRLAAAHHATGLVTLTAGETFVATSRWSWRRLDPSRPT